MKKYLLLLFLLFTSFAFLQALQGYFTIGEGGDYATIYEAFNAASSTNATDGDEVTLQLLPGQHYVDENNEATLDFRDISGDDVPIGERWINIIGTQDIDGTLQSSIVDTIGVARMLFIRRSKRVRIKNIKFVLHEDTQNAIQVEALKRAKIEYNEFIGIDHPSTNRNIFINITGYGYDLVVNNNSFHNGSYHCRTNISSSLQQWESFSFSYNNSFGGYRVLDVSHILDSLIKQNYIDGAFHGMTISARGTNNIYRNKIKVGGIGIQTRYFGHEQDPGSSSVGHNSIICNGSSWYGSYYTEASVGILAENCKNTSIYHNTVKVTSANSGSIAFKGGANNQYIDYNIFANYKEGSGAIVYVATSIPEDSNEGPTQFTNNNVYNEGAVLGIVNSAKIFNKSDFNEAVGYPNKVANPLFAENSTVPTSAQLYNGAQSGNTTDIDGNPRPVGNSSYGCYQYAPTGATTPLAGEIHIGSGYEFATLKEFALALTNRGISGAVTGLIHENQTDETVIFDDIPGIAWNKTVEIKPAPGASVTISKDVLTNDLYDRQVVLLKRSRYLKFSNLTFSSMGETYSDIIRLIGYNYDIEFYNCTFNAAESNGSSYVRNHIYSFERAKTDNFTVKYCTFNNNHVALKSYSTYDNENWLIEGCVFNNQNTTTQLSTIVGLTMYQNTVNNMKAYGFNTNGASKININSNKFISNSGRAMSIENCVYNSENVADRNYVQNNIAEIGTTTNQSCVSIGGAGLTVANNTFKTHGSGSTLYSYGLTDGTEIFNNILISINGRALDITHFDVNDAFVDYNCYYTESNNLVKYQTDYYTMAELQEALPNHDQNSIFVYPQLNENYVPQSVYLYDFAPKIANVNYDFYGAQRDLTTDLGAVKYIGHYAINPITDIVTIGESGHTYSTFEEFVNDVQLRGISGDVVCSVYSENLDGYFELRDFYKANPQDKLILHFLPNGGRYYTFDPVNTNGDDNYFLKLINAKNVKIQWLKLNLANYNHEYSFVTTKGKCDNLQFDYCSFDQLHYQKGAAIYTSSSIFDSLLVTNSNFKNGKMGIKTSGQAYDSRHFQGVNIKNCTFDSLATGVNITEADHVKIKNNRFNNNASAIEYHYGLGQSNIARNRIIYNDPDNFYDRISGIKSSGFGGDENTSDLWINNNIIVTKNTDATSFTGLSVSYGRRIAVMHNTIDTDNEGDYTTVFNASSITHLTAKNNVFSSNKPVYHQAYAVKIDANSVDTAVFESNAIFSANRYAVRVNIDDYTLNQTVPECAVLNNASFVYANPLTTDEGYVTSNYLSSGASSTAGINFDIDEVNYEFDRNFGANNIEGQKAVLTSDITVGLSGGNFNSLPDALDYIQSHGIEGRIEVKMLDAVNHVHYTFKDYPRSWTVPSRLVITNDGGNYKPALTYNGAVNNMNGLTFVSAKNVTVKNLRFTGSNPSYNRQITFEGFNEDIEILNCDFFLSENNSTSNNNAAIYNSGAIVRDLMIKDNTFNNYAYSIFLQGSNSGDYDRETIIYKNEISNGFYGINVSYADSVYVQENKFTNFPHTALGLYRIDDVCYVNKNFVESTGNQGIYLNDVCEDAAEGAKIYNNYVNLNQTGNYSLYLASSPKAEVYNNTLQITNGDNSSYAMYQEHSSEGLKLVNNILTNDTAYVARVVNDAAVELSQTNIFYTPNQVKIKNGNSSIITEEHLAIQINDTTSRIVDPELYETYKFYSTAPAVDAGTNLSAIMHDIENNPRTNNDIGCYEYALASLPAPTNFKITSISDASYIFTWDAVEGARAYRIYAKTSPNGERTFVGETTALRLSLVNYGTHNFFEITAVD